MEHVGDVPMRMDGAATPGSPEAEFVDRRRAVTPLRFEAVERRRENLRQAGIDVVQETARAQETAAAIEGLRAQLRGVPGQIEAARAQASMEARAEWQGELEACIAAERGAVVRACAQVSAERERYFCEIEGQVVRLALAIAERVLHRESKMDPMLLAASVRLALEKVAGEVGTVLRVPAPAADAWRAMFAASLDASAEVIADERLGPGDCILETNVGRVELGVSVQLEEIEKGFFDLLKKRPA